MIGVVASFGFVINANGQSVSGSIGAGTAKRGKATKATAVLTIPAGLHANSSKPGSEYAIATTVKVKANGVSIGRVTYPRGTDRKFSFSENTLNVYEGRVTFPFTVTVPANFRGDSIKVNVSIRYQACNDEVCYPPKTKDVTLTARVL